MTALFFDRQACNSPAVVSQRTDKSGQLPLWPSVMPPSRDRARYEIARRLRHLEGRPLLIDATGTHRRLRALMAIGWRARDLAPRIGWASGELDSIYRRPTVRGATADIVKKVYNDLADTPGPSEQTRRRAARAGWLPPLWWDDDTIDDPTHNPQPRVVPPTRGRPGRRTLVEVLAQPHYVDIVVVERLRDGVPVPGATVAEKLQTYVDLRNRGVSHHTASEQLRLSPTARAVFASEYDAAERVA